MTYFEEVMSRLTDGALITMLIVLILLIIVSLFRSKPADQSAKPSTQLDRCPMCGRLKS